jgi:hypothetical protein
MTKNVAWVLCSALTVVACADVTNTAVFVTSTSFGINADSKPPTIAVAYDRVEGFIGPRAENGAAPPVVGSMETDGNVFAPQIRQTYATGPAAVTVAGGAKKPESPETLIGARKPMFFGTGTTLGFRVGFGPEGVPDSLVLGYKRKEISVIPLGITPPTATEPEKAHYPSVLASIDTTARASTAGTTGLKTKQFFATGQAADALARNPIVTAAFQSRATSALLIDELTPDQRQVLATGQQSAQKEVDRRIDVIVLTVSCDGGKMLNAKLLEALVKESGVSPDYATIRTAASFKLIARENESVVNAMYATAIKPGRPACPPQ